ncbi:hypothetical protein DENSPDRAFT_862780 [Dentipellis sp. KUC8613]|nr:hypothetical protein DENSPDRAFT_862780 [Dentipellis sp. KUC8613]
MAHPLFYLGVCYFYPFGNTSATCLTRDLPPETSAAVLLLGCGDPRNILFTIFCEPKEAHRVLDFTCCDIDPAILARNVLLLSMITEPQLEFTSMWNIFYDMYLDKESHRILIDQCKRLIDCSQTLQEWHQSPYGKVLRMCSNYTLERIRHHWKLYSEMHRLARQELSRISRSFPRDRTDPSDSVSCSLVLSVTRSAGPLFSAAIISTSDHFEHYWKTGITSTSASDVKRATMVNPTFVYSLAGDTFSVQYGLDPLISFHLAPTFTHSCAASTDTVVEAAKSQFRSWCSAVRESFSTSSPHSPVIRFLLGEATVASRALQAFQNSKAFKAQTPVAPWSSQLMELDPEEYTRHGAPAAFNVVDTSNLVDHLGLLNVLVTAIPLLSTPYTSAVLYTESLTVSGDDATKDFKAQLYGNLTTIGAIINLCPIEYLSGFTARCNTHEVLLDRILRDAFTTTQLQSQYHQATTWKIPSSADVTATRRNPKGQCLRFDPVQLGAVFYDLYELMFQHENTMYPRSELTARGLSMSNLLHNTRESFVLFLRLVRDRSNISSEQWESTMVRFLSIRETDRCRSRHERLLPLDFLFDFDLRMQLDVHGLYSSAHFHQRFPTIGCFDGWTTVPPFVQIILSVPRRRIGKLKTAIEVLKTPLLQCDVMCPDETCRASFTAVTAVFGTIRLTGTDGQGRGVVFQEDHEGLHGNSPLVVSIVVPSELLVRIGPPEQVTIGLSLQKTPMAALVANRPGWSQSPTIYSAGLMDRSQVTIFPKQSSPIPHSQNVIPSGLPDGESSSQDGIGTCDPVVVTFDEQCEQIASLTLRILVENSTVRAKFQAGSNPTVVQTSACTMQITLAGNDQDVIFPFPISGSKHRVRLARKSLYIEIVVPVAGLFREGGFKLNLFPVVQEGSSINPWNIHRLNLFRSPRLNLSEDGVNMGWLKTHASTMMSHRERSLRKTHANDALMLIKDTLHSIILRSAGIDVDHPQRLFALLDKPTRDVDTFFFVNDLHFDLASHTVICDAYVLSLKPQLMQKIDAPFRELLTHKIVHIPAYEGEMRAWKQILPAFAERCRVSWQHGSNCEYLSRGIIPLGTEMEIDPLCSCGRGKDVEGMERVSEWQAFAPYVTRVALSPLFAVSYMEYIGRDPDAHKCSVCRGKGKPKLMGCSVCKTTRYCSQRCQKKDWPDHKPKCKPPL